MFVRQNRLDGDRADREAAVAVLRDAVASGIVHIDTSDFYGPQITNQIIREALHPLVRHIGLSNVTPAQIAEGRAITDMVCVQNMYNIAHRQDDALFGDLARDGIAYLPFFPLGGFSPLQSSILSDVGSRLGATPMQAALAWVLRRSPNILLIPGTSSVAHLRENLSATALVLQDELFAVLDEVAGESALGRVRIVSQMPRHQEEHRVEFRRRLRDVSLSA